MTALVLVAAFFSASVSAQNLGFGPQGCVQLSRSEGGSCVITTNCDGSDLSTTDFGFDCANKKAITRHSFGTGGFEAFEEFDSHIMCDKCENVLSVRIPAPKVHKKMHPEVVAMPVMHPAALPVLQIPAEEQHWLPQAEKKDVNFEFEPLLHPLPMLHRRLAVPAVPAVNNFHAKKHHQLLPPLVQPAPLKDHHSGKTHHPHHHSGNTHHHHHSGKVQGAVAFKALRDHKKHHDEKSDMERSAKALESSSSKWNYPWTKWTTKKKKVEHKVVKYGPKDCIETYRNKKSECVVQTRCAAEDVKSYNFGMICVGEDGVPVNHVFGKGSFDPEEKFNTLIKCKKCMGLENIVMAPAPAAGSSSGAAPKAGPKSAFGQVEELHNEIKGLTNIVLKLSKSLNGLNSVVFKHKAAGAPAPAAAAPKASFLFQTAVSTQTASKDDAAEGDADAGANNAD